MLFQTMNSDALHRTAVLMLGTDGAEALAKTYQAFASAMQNAYNQGHLAGTMEAAEENEERVDEAFDEGFEQGSMFAELEAQADTEQALDEVFDDGYLEGVDDARRVPALADDRVQAIINDRADEAFEALEDMFAEDDSDDEQVQDEA